MLSHHGIPEIDVHHLYGKLCQEAQAGTGYGYARLMDGYHIPIPQGLHDLSHTALSDAQQFCQALSAHPSPVG
ncbi:hypothetical protein SDC9_186590 [bioreactor metagenome]|uniref:Uncharacterized protein n=1 Tax=bioreactor metagenome TaxID=1076179 RepID=A0A645HSE1_9ZZZZ